MSSDPPFHETYKTLFSKMIEESNNSLELVNSPVQECELPLIDLSRLTQSKTESRLCKSDMARASREWGFFQVKNHGISTEILEKMRTEQIKVFKQPFEQKAKLEKFLNFYAGSYRWGSPMATCLKQLSWSEAFHVPLADIFVSDAHRNCNSLRSTMEQFAGAISNLAEILAKALAENLGHKDSITEICTTSTCYLRMNRYPPCLVSPLFGLMPHTDSDFLTILHQDQVGGLQLVKDGQWIAVKPNPDALIVNIGDLFQAWSNDVYKSVEHRVVTNQTVERFSTAYFLCPSYDAGIKCCGEPSAYRSFSFREYRQQVQEDVQSLGYKIGLPRFRCSN